MKNSSLLTPACVGLLLGSLFSLSPAFCEEKSPETLDKPGVATPEKNTKVPASTEKAEIQIALLLDTSSSMDGLINQARTYLWKVINDLTLGHQQGKPVHISIALYEYGNDNLTSSSEYIRKVLDFSDDLDEVSKQLFALTTNGGSEYCGAVIKKSVEELTWNKEDPNALKLIFIAGNEPFSQGATPYKSAIADALKKGITINTIHCAHSAYDNAEALEWKEGALLGDGLGVVLNMNEKIADPETPYDKDLITLGSELNSTYVAVGSVAKRKGKLMEQCAQDQNSQELNAPAALHRSVMKANKNAYKNESWDLVDKMKSEVASIDAFAGSTELPEELQKLSKEELKAHVEKKAQERTTLQTKIQDLNTQRTAWLANHYASQKDKKADSFDELLFKGIQKQAEKRHFTFSPESKSSPKTPSEK